MLAGLRYPAGRWRAAIGRLSAVARVVNHESSTTACAAVRQACVALLDCPNARSEQSTLIAGAGCGRAGRSLGRPSIRASRSAKVRGEHMFGVNTDRREQAAVLALVSRARGDWYLVAQLLEAAGSALRPARGEWTGFEPPELLSAFTREAVGEDELDGYERQIAELADAGVTLVTVLEDDYPTNLRLVYNRPPFLFVRGELRRDDDRSIAVVGTRQAHDDGLQQASRLARELAGHGVTVLSGLALGIDAAAHAAALDVGGRTVAVMGTGIQRIYPRDNDDLAGRIVGAGGALISQFWPDAPPTKYSFPMRNVVMSGMAVGTVVVEAGKTSGAKMQARLALEHGKRLFLVESLVMQEEWARKYAERPGATVVQSVDDVLAALESTLLQPTGQLTLT
jgi:DNA processing protein